MKISRENEMGMQITNLCYFYGAIRNSPTMLHIHEYWKEKMALERERLFQCERLITLQENATRTDEKWIEMEIMLKDTTRMNEMHLTYWNMNENQILRNNSLI